ncbi:hypothetical protein EYZ11_011618 [Aspergillus tanneri]|uniref:Hemopexin n=1 Tax=Aspergillus tanneri TaxID=1220188 RepID=A0A4S3J2N6_9EURO|nr:uncharacterized protein ATNIH1004_007179 [Aspergillus tanneri]KAA8645760.1 hypothetical protein ATNIH1004_007179 [Aspergillus tanneri]THC88935.1 hypothetical protein EYZ11_011618 [Aspergillus tanneri]
MVDAAFYQEDIQEGYFFAGRKYARVKWTPYGSEETRTWGPVPIKDYWGSLNKAGFGTVEAVLPVDGATTEFYFFHGSSVARIKFTPKAGDDSITDGPLKITEKWKCLAGKGFDTVDVTLAVPGKTNEAYFFKGTRYVRLNVVDDRIVYGPANVVDEWPGLAKAGFDSIQASIPIPKDKAKLPGETYFFKGDKYVRVQVIASKPDVLTWGPYKLDDYWKTLDWL